MCFHQAVQFRWTIIIYWIYWHRKTYLKLVKFSDSDKILNILVISRMSYLQEYLIRPCRVSSLDPQLPSQYQGDLMGWSSVYHALAFENSLCDTFTESNVQWLPEFELVPMMILRNWDMKIMKMGVSENRDTTKMAVQQGKMMRNLLFRGTLFSDKPEQHKDAWRLFVARIMWTITPCRKSQAWSNKIIVPTVSCIIGPFQNESF